MQNKQQEEEQHQPPVQQQPGQQPTSDAVDAAAAVASADQAASAAEQTPLEQSYTLDERGKISVYDPDDWFVPEAPHFKAEACVSAKLAGQRPHVWKRVRHHVAAENYAALPASVPTFVTLDAPPSTYPPAVYCDITGLPAPYTDPVTKLRFANADAFRAARSLSTDEVQARLALRGAATVLK